MVILMNVDIMGCGEIHWVSKLNAKLTKSDCDNVTSNWNQLN